MPYQIWPNKPEFLSPTVSHEYTMFGGNSGMFLSGPGYMYLIFGGLAGAILGFGLLGFMVGFGLRVLRDRPFWALFILYFLVRFLSGGDAFDGLYVLTLMAGLIPARLLALLFRGVVVRRGHGSGYAGAHIRVGGPVGRASLVRDRAAGSATNLGGLTSRRQESDNGVASRVPVVADASVGARGTTVGQAPRARITRRVVRNLESMPELIGIYVRSRSSRRASALLVTRVIGLLLGVAATALVARSLLPAGFATFSLAITLSTLTILATDFGVSPIVVREIHSGNPKDLLPTVAAMRTALGLFGGTVALIVAFALTHKSGGFLVCAIILATAPLAGLGTAMIFAQATSRIYAYSGFLLLQSVMWTVTAVALYAAHATEYVWALGFALSSVITGLCVYGYRWTAFRGGKVDFRLAKTLMKEAWMVGLATFIILAYHRLDYLILYAIEPANVTGIYAAAFRLLDQAFLVPTALVVVAVPRIAGNRHSLSSSGTRQDSYRFVLLIASVLTILIFAAPEFLLHLAFGPAYTGAANLVRILAFCLPAMACSLMAFQLNIVDRRTRPQCLIAGAVLAVTGVITVPLILVLGSTGAAIATVCTECLAALWFVWLDRVTWSFDPRGWKIGNIVTSWNLRWLAVMSACGVAAYCLRGNEIAAESTAIIVGIAGALLTDLVPRGIWKENGHSGTATSSVKGT